MESGTVIAVSGNGGMIKVRSATTVTIIEMLGDEGELGVGDLVRGNWTSLGGETIYRNGKLSTYSSNISREWNKPTISLTFQTFVKHFAFCKTCHSFNSHFPIPYDCFCGPA